MLLKERCCLKFYKTVKCLAIENNLAESGARSASNTKFVLSNSDLRTQTRQEIVRILIPREDSKMKKIKWRNQIISILGMFALLIATGYFYRLEESLKEIAGATFDIRLGQFFIWYPPVAAVLFAVCWLVLFKFFIKHSNKFTAIFYLIVGFCVVFYPSITVIFGSFSTFRITVDYFRDTVFFYSGAVVMAMGLIGIITPSRKKV